MVNLQAVCEPLHELLKHAIRGLLAFCFIKLSFELAEHIARKRMEGVKVEVLAWASLFALYFWEFL